MASALRRSNDAFKVVLLGEGRVGKTSLMLRYVENKFNETHNSTLQASFLTKRLSDPPVSVAIWDTAGQEKFHALGPLYYRDADGALLIYDITDPDSFARAKKWVSELHTVLGVDSHVVLILVGNKSDLSTRRNVSHSEGAEYAASVGAAHYEISVKLNQGVEELALQMVEARTKRNKTSAVSANRSTEQTQSFAPTAGSSRVRGIQLDDSDISTADSGGSRSCNC